MDCLFIQILIDWNYFNNIRYFFFRIGPWLKRLTWQKSLSHILLDLGSNCWFKFIPVIRYNPTEWERPEKKRYIQKRTRPFYILSDPRACLNVGSDLII